MSHDLFRTGRDPGRRIVESEDDQRFLHRLHRPDFEAFGFGPDPRSVDGRALHGRLGDLVRYTRLRMQDSEHSVPSSSRQLPVAHLPVDLAWHLKWNSCRSPKHRLLYVASPKAACTSVKWWMAEIEGVRGAVEAGSGRSVEPDPDLAVHDVLPVVAPNVAGLSDVDLEHALFAVDYFRFSMVRHPVARLFSAWQSKLFLREPLHAGPYVGCEFMDRRISCAADIAGAFEGFLEHLAARESGAFQNPHWTPQVHLLRPDLIRYGAVFRFEAPGELRETLARVTGIGDADPLGGRNRNSGVVRYSAELITPRAIELARELHSGDYEAFGYETEPPKGAAPPSAEACEVLERARQLIVGRHQQLAAWIQTAQRLEAEAAARRLATDGEGRA